MVSQSSNNNFWPNRMHSMRLGTSQSQPPPPPGGIGANLSSTPRPPPVALTGAALSTPPHRTPHPTKSTTEEPYQDPPRTNITPLRNAIAESAPTQSTTGQYDVFVGTVDNDSSKCIAASINNNVGVTSQSLLSGNNADPPHANDINKDSATLLDDVNNGINPPKIVPTSINLPDTPSLHHQLGDFNNKLRTDMGQTATLTSRDALMNAFATLRNEMASTQAQMASTQAQMKDSQCHLDEVLNIMSTLVTKDELTSLLTGIIQREFGSKLNKMQQSITKLSDRVHSSASTLGHVTNTKIPDLERDVAGLLGARALINPTIVEPLASLGTYRNHNCRLCHALGTRGHAC
jgi:hypothetical protein